MSSHCHREHSENLGHDHEHGHENHDHSDDVSPALQYSLYQHIDFDKITCLNESETGSCVAIVKKTWAERLETSPFLESDADEQLLIHVPFTGQVKLYSILIRTSCTGSSPQTLKLFANRYLDFSSACDLSPIQEIKLPQSSEVQDIQVKRALFGKVQNLTLFIEDNYGDSVTNISYLGFKGNWMQMGRAPTNILYEAAANPRDHAIKGTHSKNVGSNVGGNRDDI
ncbi:PITH domain-containing protein [Golovinomyces cichoracearum]|uniref:PITH domain-containing protein n=1 Tax=Golovinomyces cichoracearum TaxID=62708 RepID=A0A420HJV8_9PEZI|nr:PITH domain-containing protein [Golovinomyces cichoracearum]